MKTSSILEKHGMDWNVQKIPLSIGQNEAKKISSYYHLIRADSGTVLGSCSMDHIVVQNKDVYNEILSIIKKHRLDLKICKVGSLDPDGRHVFFEMESSSFSGFLGFDRCMATAVLHHDTGNTDFYHSFYHSSEKILFNIKIQSSGSLEQGILEISKNEIFQILGSFDDHFLNNPSEFVDFLINPNNLPSSSISNRKKTSKKDLLESIQTSLDSHGNTLSSVLKGVIRYSMRIRTKDVRTSSFIGKAFDISNRAFVYLSEQIDP